MYDRGKQVHEFHNHGTAMNANLYENKVTEAWFWFANMAKEHRVSMPNDQRAIKQFSTRQYDISTSGRVRIEPKEKYKERLEGESPDRADAMAMAFYPYGMGGGRVA